MEIDIQFCLFYSTVFIAFSIGLHLQSIIEELVNYVWMFVIISVVLLALAVLEYKKQKRKK